MRISVAVTPGSSSARRIAGAAGTKPAAATVVNNERLFSMNSFSSLDIGPSFRAYLGNLSPPGSGRHEICDMFEAGAGEVNSHGGIDGGHQAAEHDGSAIRRGLEGQ